MCVFCVFVRNQGMTKDGHDKNLPNADIFSPRSLQPLKKKIKQTKNASANYKEKRPKLAHKL